MPAVRDSTVRDTTISIRARRAQQLLLDRAFFGLDGKACRRFLKMLDEPARPNAALKRLLASRAPWER